MDKYMEKATSFLKNRYAVLVLSIIIGFMVFLRIQTADNFITDSGIVFSGNDAWYHLREVTYTTKHWPFSIDFDPWTGYPTGNQADQFGTLYDKIIATVALIVGFGSPSQETIKTVLMYAPVAFSSLTVIPVYLITKRYTSSKITALFAGALLALIPGVFFRRGLVAFSDHNIAEPFFMSFAVFGIIVANEYAKKDAIVLENVIDKNTDLLLQWSKRSLFAGFLIGLYLLAWSPGLILLGILSVYYAIYTVVGYYLNENVDAILLTGAAATVPVSALMLFKSGFTTNLSVTTYSLIHVITPLLVSLGCLFLLFTYREFEKRDIEWYSYGGFIIAFSLTGVFLMSVLTPKLWNIIRSNVMRTVGFGGHANLRTIGEAAPLARPGKIIDALLAQYSSLYILALLAVVIATVQIIRNNTNKAHEEVLLSIWTLILLAAAITQVRFNYYFAVPVAIMAAVAVHKIFHYINIPETYPSIKVYQVFIVVVVLFVPLAGLFVPASGSVFVQATHHGPGGYMGWKGSLEWMDKNTPEQGMEGGANNTMEKYISEPSDTQDYEYENGTYGTLSWWDYGHWLTVTGDQIPVANPFQQHATVAAQYLLATNTEDAEEHIKNLSTEDSVKYVAIDWQMVTPEAKFFAPVTFNPNTTPNLMYDGQMAIPTRKGYVYGFRLKSQRYYQSLVNRLYFYHGSRAEPPAVTISYRQTNRQGVLAAAGPNAIKRHKSLKKARNYSSDKEGVFTQVGGFGAYPRQPVEALEHYRLVHASKKSAIDSAYRNWLKRKASILGDNVSLAQFNPFPSWVKIFERVEGAKVKGTGALPNSTVTAGVCMKTEAFKQPFLYKQQAKADENGNFEFTLPYSTSGYDNWGTEKGETNVSVRASPKNPVLNCQTTLGNGSKKYIITAPGRNQNLKAQLDVPEGVVTGRVDKVLRVDISPSNPNKNVSEPRIREKIN